MALALSTNPRDGEGLCSKASLSAAPSIAHHQHQRWAQTERGNSLGPSASIYAADKAQNWSASRRAGIASCLPRLVTSRGFGSDTFHSHRPESSPGRLVVLHAFASGRTITNSSAVNGSSRSRANPLSHQQPVQIFADGSHVQVLSSSLVCWINNCQQARTLPCHSVTRDKKCTRH